MPNSAAIEQISKRVDNVEEDVDKLQEHAHESEKAIVAIDSTLKNVVNNQSQLSAEVVELKRDISDWRFVKTNKRSIFWIIVASAFLGFSVQTEAREVWELFGKFL
jgi:septal ring factor EnvC (AmiA/AmiB activator)